jgi:exonuclease III
MVSFLFWNLDRKPLHSRVVRLARHYQIDVLMLAECEVEPDTLVKALNRSGGRPYSYPFTEEARLKIFTRFPPNSMTPVFDSLGGRLTIRRLIVRKFPNILLAVVHFPSKIHWTDEEQLGEATNLARDLARAEEEHGHRRTILVGDLNMHPFDKGVVSAHGLHAVMTSQVASRQSRTVTGRDYPFFYNPMWGCFGDRTAGPAGSYYYATSGPIRYFWNIFDQVLLRPDLVSSLVDLQILDTDGAVTLLSASGLPDRSDGSDHLPIFFKLDL